MQNFWSPLKVGVLTMGALLSAIYGIAEVTKSSLDDDNSYVLTAVFQDASGLRTKSRVQIAGIEVGQIDDIRLEGARARVYLRVKKEVPLHLDARASKRSEGFIGDMALDLWPGTEEKALLKHGDEIKDVQSMGDMDKVFATLGDITEDIQAMTSNLRTLLAGDDVGGIKKIIDEIGLLTEKVNETIGEAGVKLKAILEDVQEVTGSVTDLADEEAKTVSSILRNVDKVSQQMQAAITDVQDVLATVKGVLGTSEGELKDGVAGIRQSLEKVNSSLDQLNSVTTKISEGEGTIGRLVTDDTLIREIEETVGDAADFVDRLIKLQTEVSLISEFHTRKASSRENLGLRLIPSEDKWYEVAVISPPRGIPEIETTDVIDENGNVTTTTLRTTKNGIGFNLLFAHRWRMKGWSVTGKFGLIETTGGLAGDVGLFGEHLRLSVEAYEFTSMDRKYPRVRAFATISFLKHLYVTGGVDDALNPTTVAPAGVGGADAARFELPARDFFVGAGFYFTDEDLKTLLTTVGVPSMGGG
ncbi:MAG: MlaD family protein [Deltaproteobacteria bacterium]|nr:MlaD family protein [Deltaproteobacteria bacterium]